MLNVETHSLFSRLCCHLYPEYKILEEFSLEAEQERTKDTGIGGFLLKTGFPVRSHFSRTQSQQLHRQAQSYQQVPKNVLGYCISQTGHKYEVHSSMNFPYVYTSVKLHKSRYIISPSS